MLEKGYYEVLNILENFLNLYRVVFVVVKLIEGWDVLNFYDIVCIFDIDNVKGNKVLIMVEV